MKKQLYLFAFLLCFAFSLKAFAQAPDWLWAKGFSAVSGLSSSHSIAIDAAGNSYVTGSFMGTSLTIGNTVLINSDYYGYSNEFFVAKFNAAGIPVWAKKAGGVGSAIAWGIAADSAGNCYVTGNFNPGPISFGAFTLNKGGSMFVVKYNTSGTPMWASEAGGGAGTAVARAITVDYNGNCYITGYCYNEVTFDSVTLPGSLSTTGHDAFIVKYNPLGTVAWANRSVSYYDEVGRSVAVDRKGNCYLTGECASTNVDFGNNVALSGQYYRMFNVKYNSAGSAIWARGSAADIATSVKADSMGNSFVTGSFYGFKASFDTFNIYNPYNSYSNYNNNLNVYVVKYDTAGTVRWAVSAGGQLDEYSTGIGLDRSGALYLTGSFQDSALFGTTLLTSQGKPSMFVAKFDDTGAVVWANKANGPAGVRGEGIAVDAGGNSYITGLGVNGTTFGTISITTNTIGGFFVAKLNSCKEPKPVIVKAGNTLSVSGIFPAYQWYRNGNSLPGATSPTYTITQAGSYYVGVTDSTGCSGKSDLLPVTTGVEAPEQEQGIAVYPNPIQKTVYLRFSSAVPRTICFTNIMGQIMQGMSVASGNNSISVDAGSWPAGIYFLTYRSENGSKTIKLLKE